MSAGPVGIALDGNVNSPYKGTGGGGGGGGGFWSESRGTLVWKVEEPTSFVLGAT